MISLLLLPAVALAGTVWKSTDSHGGILYCDGNQRMTGFCAPGTTRDCWQDGGARWEAGKLQCSDIDTSVAPVEQKWITSSEHGDDISCPVEMGYSAVGVCSSGRRWDCRCTGTSEEGCTDRWAWMSHMLRCAKGVELVSTVPKVEVTATDWGNDVSCPAGYVVYRVCSSGRDRNCRDRYNNYVSHLMGCIKVKEAPKKGDPERVIKEVKGHWESCETHNDVFKYIFQEAIIDTKGTALSNAESSVYSFSQSLSVTVEVGVAALGNDGGVDTTASFGASQEFGKEIVDTVTRSWSTTTSHTFEENCGGSKTGFETIYQWIIDTETEDGNPGPSIKTKTWLCALGVAIDPDSPRCVPGFCMNDHKCDICEYDYCEIKAVRTDATNGLTFEFDTDCGDMKLGQKDWKAGSTFEAEHVSGDVTKGNAGITVIKKGLIKLDRAEGTSSGYWTGADVGGSVFKVGDRVRVIKIMTVARRSAMEIVSENFVWVGVPAVGVALFAFTMFKWSKTHSEINENLIA